jgi:hypothetical protein
VQLISLLALDNSPDVLESKARDIIKTLGYKDRPADTASGFIYNNAYFRYLQPKMASLEQWKQIIVQPPSPLGFWYRQSPVALLAEGDSGQITMANPKPTGPGNIVVLVDPDGRLWRFQATPPEKEKPESTPQVAADWAPFFDAAGLDIATLKPAEPEWTPEVATDVRAAWIGPYLNHSDMQVRVEAASFHGRPVFFRIFWPWIAPTRTPPAPTLSSNIQTGIILLVAIATMAVARYNWKAGRSDPRSAVRIGLYCAVMSLLTILLSSHYTGASQDPLVGRDVLLAWSAAFSTVS